MGFRIVGLGELLWDLLPDGKKLGGAPANFAFHARSLGEEGLVASRIGADPLGREIAARLAELGLPGQYVQEDPGRPTGTVQVLLDPQGMPTYTITPEVAWDYLAWTPELAELAETSDAVCFGSLAQRSPTARGAIRRFLAATRRDALRLFDVNLRQSWYSAEVLRESLQAAGDREAERRGAARGFTHPGTARRRNPPGGLPAPAGGFRPSPGVFDAGRGGQPAGGAAGGARQPGGAGPGGRHHRRGGRLHGRALPPLAARLEPGAHRRGRQPVRLLGGRPGRRHAQRSERPPRRRPRGRPEVSRPEVNPAASPPACSPGKPMPLGASLAGDGVQFAVFSRHATAVSLLLFDRAEDAAPAAELPLDPERHRTGDIWHAHVPGLRAGQCYLYRVDGPYAPRAGHRFNPNRLLLDPYAKAITGSFTWHLADARGFEPGSPAGDLSFATASDAAGMPKCIVVDDAFDWQGDRPLNRPLRFSVIYEAHVRGLTMHSSARDRGVRHPGTFRGITELIPYLSDLGITALELLPVQEFDELENIRLNPLTGERLHQLLGLQHHELLRPEGEVLGRGVAGGAGDRVQGDGPGAAPRGDRGDPGHRVQPHRRGGPDRARPSASAAWTTSFTTCWRRTNASTRTTPAAATP